MSCLVTEQRDVESSKPTNHQLAYTAWQIAEHPESQGAAPTISSQEQESSGIPASKACK